ncbi:S-layer homology domain-containing protein [Cohnella silvisoli]|uniref:S-layer homology domain-containing protein n=1 Tax=Cohnella silvisoli TaxID=2873699 RepID=A0ABV1KPB1_9BACL|nr:S-layer homology domain-containing protein [Cohnella silvisoli]MCD9021094.1 S-layer homology domain-containing protein [Cohnella silvisoli]
MKTRLSKWISGMMAVSLIWTGVSWTTTSVSAASTRFSDVVAGHWAEKHINKLALQGILKGGTDGKFNPNNSVSRQEAVIIALRFMGIDTEASPTDVIVIPSVLVIKNDYKHYLNLALKKKLLVVDEEVALANKETGKQWGSSPATREWMTRLLVRAIGKDADAKQSASQATSFSDDSQIDAKLRGYVNVAISSGLMKGVTDKKFEPQSVVTRATASTLFSRAEVNLPVAYSGQVSGVLLAITADKLTLLHSDGVMKDYTFTPTSSIYRFDSEKVSSLANLRLFGEVNLINKSDGSILYVEQTSDTPKVKTYEGTLTLVSESKNRLTVLIDDEYKTFTYDPAHLPSITDTNGQTITLANLPVNVDVKLTVDTVRADGKIVAVSVKQSVINKTGSGAVAAWDTATRSLQVKDSVTGKTDSFIVAANATIKQNGANLALDQLKVGDTISYEVKTGSVSSIVITKTEKPSVTGLFMSISKTEKTILYKQDNKPKVAYFLDNTKVSITGLPDATFDDLYKDDAVTLSLDENENVTLITVTARSVQMLNGAIVAGYVAGTKTLSLIDATGKARNLFLGSNVRYDLNGAKLTPEAALPLITATGKKLNVGYSGENAFVISIVSKYSGTVTENNVTTKTLKLALDATNTIPITYNNPSVEIYGQTGKTYSDILVGNVVTVILSANQDQAASILVQKNAQFEVASVDTATNKLRAKRADGVFEEWTIAPSISLQNENGSTITLNALSAGIIINVTFQGNSPTKVKAVSTTFGKVSSVNTASASLDIVTSSGAVETKAVGATPLVVRDGTVLGSLSSVKSDDRVEIRNDENDRVVITIIPALSKIFWRYDNSAQLLYVKIETLGETNNYYSLSSNVYIHKGTTAINLTNLQNDDAITLYVLRGKVVEIAK